MPWSSSVVQFNLMRSCTNRDQNPLSHIPQFPLAMVNKKFLLGSNRVPMKFQEVSPMGCCSFHPRNGSGGGFAGGTAVRVQNITKFYLPGAVLRRHKLSIF